MVLVIVGDQNKINLADSRLFGRRHYAVGIAPFISWPTCINQQRFARGGDKQGGLATLYVDKVNLQRLLSSGRRRGVSLSHQPQQATQGCAANQDTQSRSGWSSVHDELLTEVWRRLSMIELFFLEMSFLKT